MSLVLFLGKDSSPSVLRSRSAPERLARECVGRGSVHLLVLGVRGVNAASLALPGRGAAMTDGKTRAAPAPPRGATIPPC